MWFQLNVATSDCRSNNMVHAWCTPGAQMVHATLESRSVNLRSVSESFPAGNAVFHESLASRGVCDGKRPRLETRYYGESLPLRLSAVINGTQTPCFSGRFAFPAGSDSSASLSSAVITSDPVFSTGRATSCIQIVVRLVDFRLSLLPTAFQPKRLLPVARHGRDRRWYESGKPSYDVQNVNDKSVF